jgi:hypothetical protein
MTNLNTSPDRLDAIRGPWRAVLADDLGFVTEFDALEDGDEVSIHVVRDRDMPIDDHGAERLPGTRVSGILDTLYVHDDLIVGDDSDDVEGRWAQAQGVAAALNGRNGINDLPVTTVRFPELAGE